MGALTALELLTAVGTGLSAVSTLSQLTKHKDSGPLAAPAAPQIVPATAAEDAVAAQDKASQEAQQRKLAQRRAARANSLLSEAAGVGDPSQALVTSTQAFGKLTLGS